MNLLIVCHEYPPIGGGAAAVCAALAAEYVRDGHAVVVLTEGFDGLPRRERVEGVDLWRIPCGRKRKEVSSAFEGLLWARRAWKVARRLQNDSPFDAVHAHFIMPAGIVADRLKRRRGVPWIVTAHGTDVPGFNRERMKIAHRAARHWWKAICRRADKIICPSASLLQLIAKATSDFQGQVIPNGFRSGRFQPGEKQKRLLLCSRLVERKGFQYFLEAISGLDLAGWEVDIVGDGPMFERLAELAGRCRVPVKMHGWIDNDDPQLAELYGRAMIFVLPSEWENFSIALLEGMSAGCAVITTDVAGNPEAVGETGHLVPPRDIEALKRSVVELCGDLDRCRDLGERAVRRANELFDWSILSRRYLSELATVVKPDSRGEKT